MPVFLDTRGNSTLGIGICARCSEKLPLGELFPDPNSPGLRVCKDDLDGLDRWRLPSRPADNLVLEYPRPDTPLSPGPALVAINPLQAVIAGDAAGDPLITEKGQPIALADPVTQKNVSTPWAPNTPYAVNAQVTISNPVGFAAAGVDFYLFTCVVPGVSGETAPAWTTQAATIVNDQNIIWLNAGLYLEG